MNRLASDLCNVLKLDWTGLLLLLLFQPPVAGGVPEREQGLFVVSNYKGRVEKEIKKFFGNFFGVGILIIENINFKTQIIKYPY